MYGQFEKLCYLGQNTIFHFTHYFFSNAIIEENPTWHRFQSTTDLRKTNLFRFILYVPFISFVRDNYRCKPYSMRISYSFNNLRHLQRLIQRFLYFRLFRKVNWVLAIRLNMSNPHTYQRKSNRQSWFEQCMSNSLEASQNGTYRYLKTAKQFGVPKSPLARRYATDNSNITRRRRDLFILNRSTY